MFAVPGPVTSPLSEAPHELIRDGARLIRGPADLLEDLGFEAMQVEAVSLDGLPAAEGEVLAALREPMLPDAVSRAAGLSIPDTVAALVRLEIRGLVQGNGGRYRRTVQLAAEAPGGRRRAGCRARGRERPTPIRVIASAVRPLGRYALAVAGPSGAPGEDPCHPEPTTMRCPRPSVT